MDTDDLEPIAGPKKPKDLEVMSIEALEEYVAELKAEIERAEAQINAKQSHRSAADAIFKS
ncbi:MAG TPA: DUF1192 domain-containing protein [Rhodospirillaceae bacterium]|nr:DUF1192 domain-containing protein [Rhodospirillaceae bacterium]HAA92999.1 DUF1192 domain-containing protein [Rhodospirillaceae bacterium]HAT35311.1 DUF1192 domain-containing protein [Rhodospirillaceae bacterium]|tara:strand:+ start:417 stop:599 length:183 start_codon:yes stop_codon:yes gene_type:complete